jgi:hypothetical protein
MVAWHEVPGKNRPLRLGPFGSGDCPTRPLTFPMLTRFRSDRLALAKRAVAIRALGWRLRVEVGDHRSLRSNRWEVYAYTSYWTVAATESV